MKIMLNFLELKQLAFGLEISDHSLKIAQIQKSGTFFKLVSFNEVLLRPGLVQKGEIKNITELAEIIKRGIKDVKGKKIKTKKAIVALPEERAFLEIVQMPLISKKELFSAVLLTAENHIPLSLEEVYLDYEIVSSFNQPINKLNVLLVAFPREIIDTYLICFKKADIRPVVLENESLAISRALISNKNNLSSPLFIIDFGAERTIFIFYAFDAVRFVFSSTFSSYQLNEAIAQAMKVDLTEAEKLKFKYGLTTKFAGQDHQIFNCLLPFLEDLIQQIKKYFAYCETHFLADYGKQLKIKKILISGGGAQLKGLSSFLSFKLNLPVELADPLINLREQSVFKSKKDFLSYSSVLGLALRGARGDD